MFKRPMLVGIVFFGLMVLLQTQAMAGYCSAGTCYTGGGFNVKCITFTSEWLIKNTTNRPTSYAVTICPDNTLVQFKNPGDGTGGTSSLNFINTDTNWVAEGSSIAPQFTGKGKITDKINFGDCNDNCADIYGNYNNNGQLWYLWYNEASNDPAFACGSNPDNAVATINCIKNYLNYIANEPNAKWMPYGVQIYTFDAVLKAWRDYNMDGTQEPVVYVEFPNCTVLGGTGVVFGQEIPTGTPYTCGTGMVWQYDKLSAPTAPIAPSTGFTCGGSSINWTPPY